MTVAHVRGLVSSNSLCGVVASDATTNTTVRGLCGQIQSIRNQANRGDAATAAAQRLIGKQPLNGRERERESKLILARETRSLRRVRISKQSQLFVNGNRASSSDRFGNRILEESIYLPGKNQTNRLTIIMEMSK